MNVEVSFKSFCGWVIAGCGLHVGWGLIALIIWALAKAIGMDSDTPRIVVP